MTNVAVAAVDLGASSGRVMVGNVGAGHLSLDEVHRFPNVPVRTRGTLHWDILRLYGDILEGLRAAARHGVGSIGIDTWAVDYGLLDASGALLGNPVHYRDGRTAGVLEHVVAEVPEQELYATTGIQQLPFNTLYHPSALWNAIARRCADDAAHPDCSRTGSPARSVLKRRTRRRHSSTTCAAGPGRRT